MRLSLLLCLQLVAVSAVHSQTGTPHLWLPMTGVNERQMEEAREAGYDTIMLKIHPPIVDNERRIDFTSTDKQIELATSKGFDLFLPILGWVGLGNGQYWDTRENGEKVMNRLDPFWLEAMDQLEWYYAAVIDHYKTNPRVVAFAPTWGIYGEAGFTSFDAGRSEHALARFNEWRGKQGLPALDALPARGEGPNTEYNRFIRFRYLYIEEKFDGIISRMKQRTSVPVGMWQELYPVIGHLWTMAEIPSADFALYESCFPFQSNHNVESSFGETMGFRYRCNSADDYRDYYLPLLARKRGEGGRFMGCQLTNDYAVQNYKWSQERVEEIKFDRWEDEFSPHLKKLQSIPLERPKRDVLLVFPTYAAATLGDHPRYACDTMLIDILLRAHGCQMVRCGSPKLDKMTLEEMNGYRLIIVPQASFVMESTYERLKMTKAKVLFTGSFARAMNGELTPTGKTRQVDGLELEYLDRPTSDLSVAADHALTRGLDGVLPGRAIQLSDDEAFRYCTETGDAKVLLKAGNDPLLSVRRGGRMIFLHGNLFASACHNPGRVPPELAGSADPSANEVDMWGPYDSAHPQNAFTARFMKNLLDYARVDYRVPDPLPRTFAPYLGDHMEQASVSGNIVYNNMGESRTLTVRTPYKPRGYDSRLVRGRYETVVAVPAFSYIALEQ